LTQPKTGVVRLAMDLYRSSEPADRASTAGIVAMVDVILAVVVGLFWPTLAVTFLVIFVICVAELVIESTRYLRVRRQSHLEVLDE
jgi:Flp pilus assembly protein TadB